MNNNGANKHRAPVKSEQSLPVRRRSPWPLALLAALFILLPFLSWYGTTFWRQLTDAEIEEYLRDEQRPRHVQHALEQIDQRIVKRDARVKRWYPQIVALGNNSVTDIRLAAAWVMGDDNQAEDFHAALKQLLDDMEPAVRRMAALSLSRFNDRSCRPALLEMLRPYSVKMPFPITVVTVLPVGTPVKREGLLARVRDEKGTVVEFRSPLAGRIEKLTVGANAGLDSGDELLVLSPDSESIRLALVGLYLVGEPDDVPEIDRFAQGSQQVGDEIKKQAALTAEAIKSRK